MANVYVRSGAAGAGTGADWANAYTTLAAALTAKAAGDDFWVSEDHAETQASAMTLTSPGTNASPCRVVCVNHSGSVPPVSADLRTTATISTSGTNNLTISGSAYFYGITFTAGSGAGDSRLNVNQTGTRLMRFEACVLNVASTAAGRVLFGGAPQDVTDLVNTSLKFGNTAGQLQLPSTLRWWNSVALASGSSVPTTLLLVGGTTVAVVEAIAVDFSAFTSGKSLWAVTASALIKVTMVDCKLGASVTINTGTIASLSVESRLVNCDSADTNYRYQKQTYQGTITQETTIVKSSTLSTDGTTPLTWKMVTTATSRWYAPLESDWMAVWVDSTGSKTLTVSVVTDNVTLTDAECWVEVRYQADAAHASPLGAYASDRSADPLAAGTNQTTESPTWTTTGLTTPVKQKLNTTVTTTGKGLIWVRVCLAKASTTVYVDAAPVVT